MLLLSYSYFLVFISYFYLVILSFRFFPVLHFLFILCFLFFSVSVFYLLIKKNKKEKERKNVFLYLFLSSDFLFAIVSFFFCLSVFILFFSALLFFAFFFFFIFSPLFFLCLFSAVYWLFLFSFCRFLSYVCLLSFGRCLRSFQLRVRFFTPLFLNPSTERKIKILDRNCRCFEIHSVEMILNFKISCRLHYFSMIFCSKVNQIEGDISFSLIWIMIDDSTIVIHSFEKKNIPFFSQIPLFFFFSFVLTVFPFFLSLSFTSSLFFYSFRSRR